MITIIGSKIKFPIDPMNTVYIEEGEYIDFDSVSDFYKAHWLSKFPQGTTWSASGLDDGAEYFYALITYKNHYIKINVNEQIEVCCGISVL